MVGVDLVAIVRIERLLGKYGVSFLQNFLRKSEIALCLKKTQGGEYSEILDDLHVRNADISRFNVERIAGFYAAKEAISKALECGISKHLTFKDIRLSKDSRGAPKAKLSKCAKKHFGVKKIHLSISHDKAQIRGSRGDKSNKNDSHLSPHSVESKGFAIAVALVK